MQLHFATNRFGDRYVLEINGHDFKDVSSEAVFSDRYRNFKIDTDSLHIFIGTDSGLLFKFFLNIELPDSSYIVFVEHKDIIGHIPKNNTKNNKNIIVCSDEDLYNLLQSLDVERYYFTDRLYISESLGSLNTMNKEYQRFRRNTWEVIHRVIYSLGITARHRFFIERILQNVPENRYGAELLVNALKGYTGVMLGAGPSLELLLPWVRENRERLAVFAVARIAERLQQEGIVPDVVISVDPFEVSFYESRAMLEFPPETILVHSTHVHPGLLSQWRGPAVFAGPKYPWVPSVFDAPGPTVGHAGVWTAFQTGCSPIILGGIDLCFSKEGKTHAVGEEDVKADLAITQGIIHVRTNGGWIAETDLPFAKGIETLGMIAGKARAEGVRIINPAPGAARVDNIEHLPVHKINPSPVAEPAKKRLLAKIPPDSREERLAHYEAALEDLRKARSTLRRIQKIAENGIRVHRRLLQNPTGSAIRSADRKLRRYEEQLKDRYAGFRTALMRFDTERFVKALRPSTELKEAPIEAGLDFFEAFYEAAQGLVERIGEAEKRLHARIEEEADQPRWTLVFKQWEQDRQPGRAVLWKHRNPDRFAGLPPRVRQRLEEQEKRYRELMSEEGQFPLFFQEGAALERALQGYSTGDKDALGQLFGALARHPSPKAKSIRLFVDGLLAQLEGRAEKALSRYKEAAETSEDGSPTWEAALRQYSVLCLEHRQYDSALAALRKLSEANPIYSPRYAKVLAAVGRPLDALEVYRQHLTSYPDDLENMLEMGLLCRRIGAKEVAAQVLEHVVRAAGEGQKRLALRAKSALAADI